MEKALQYLDPEDYFAHTEPLRVFHHPSFQKDAKTIVAAAGALNLRECFGIFSSGTSSANLKGYIHTLTALESNARAVNDFFGLTSQDTWGLSLPDYHIGGVQVLLRARLLGAKVADLRGWDPERWYSRMSSLGVRVTSVVPTQVHDLVSDKIKAPPGLRLLIVGGDFLSKELETRARQLGWPIIRTFGMTELGSQIASSTPEDDSLTPLPLHQLKTNGEGVLQVKSPALFSYRFEKKENWDFTPLSSLLDAEGYFQTQDIVDLKANHIVPLGRSGDFFKTGGHLILLGDLRETLQRFLLNNSLFGRAEIYLQDDDRKGKKIILLHEGIAEPLLRDLSESFRPIKIDETRSVEKIDRTALGKATRL